MNIDTYPLKHKMIDIKFSNLQMKFWNICAFHVVAHHNYFVRKHHLPITFSRPVKNSCQIMRFKARRHKECSQLTQPVKYYCYNQYTKAVLRLKANILDICMPLVCRQFNSMIWLAIRTIIITFLQILNIIAKLVTSNEYIYI